VRDDRMKEFQVALTRTYIVSLRAKTVDEAKMLSEYYLGDLTDLSTENERNEKQFSFDEIEMVYNHATEIEIA
jgi:hypothetical protein